MKLARILAAAILLLASTTAYAGTMHPALQARLAEASADEPISVIVNMRDQAPISELNDQLKFANANPVDRHRTIIDALKTAANSQESLKADLSNNVRGGSVLGYTSYWISNLVVVYALPAEIRRLAARPDVDFVELNFKPELITPTKMSLIPDSPVNTETPTRGIGVTPGVRACRAPEVWYQLGYNGTGRLIGSCDTGVDGNHPALASRWRCAGGAHPWQEGWLDLLGTNTTSPNDGYGHGTHTTGTMTGLGVATQDTVGMAWGAKWIATNVINQNVSQAFDSDVIAAFQWFADPDGNPNTIDDVPDVVQNSWGVNEGFTQTPPYTDCDTRWWAVLDNCEALGIVTCWSAGNEGPTAGSLRSPSDRATTLTNCFSVGAVSATSGQQFPYAIASFSSRGPSGCNVPAIQKFKPEVSAPGVQVYSSVPGGGYSSNWDGTSMAGPHVAGIVPLIRQANPGLSVDAIKTIIMQTARDEGTVGEDNTYGWGFVDAHAAVIAATVGFGTIEGHVYNRSWGNAPLAGAKVRLVETGVQFTTNAQGFYTGSAAAGIYTVQASADGFNTQTFQVTLTSNQTTTRDFLLDDIAGPVITNVSQPGSTTDPVGPYAISATIYDASTVASARLFYRANFGLWIETPMTLNAGVYQGSIPGQNAGTRIDYYVSATDGPGHVASNPSDAPASSYSLFITQVVYAYDAENPDAGWLLGMSGDAATSGVWIRDDPVGTVYGTPSAQIQPEDDHTPTPGVKCFVTANGAVGGAAGDADVDGGCTTLRSPIFDLSTAGQAFVNYWRWFAMAGLSQDDTWAVDASSDGGATWVPLERIPENRNYWQKVTVDLSTIITLTNQVTFRFQACDLGSGGLIEAAIDDFSIETFAADAASVDDGAAVVTGNLEQNMPNPFRAGANLTNIRFNLSTPGDAKLAIFDASGRLVRTLFQGRMESGSHTMVWNGLDDEGTAVGSGVYFYRLTSGQFEQSRRLTILK